MLDKEKLISLFGLEWYEALSEYISGKDFYQLACKISQLRLTKEIYPSRENIFRCFRETPYNKVKTVLLAMDPYHDGSADGLAFSNSMSKTISPSLRNILKEIDDEYPENKELITHGKLDPQDLSRLAKQGVLLLNSSLTVEKGKAGSHLELWKPFTIKILQTLNTKNDIIWLFLGKESQIYAKFATNITHSVLKVSHPAAELYKPNAGFFGSNCFRECNNQLLARNKKEVVW